MGTINKSDNPQINRGVELLLRKGREINTSEDKPKKIGFSKVFSLLKREIHIEFYFNILERK